MGGMVVSLLYLAFRALLDALVRSRRGLDVKDVELLELVDRLLPDLSECGGGNIRGVTCARLFGL
jgi:hypothetical protein